MNGLLELLTNKHYMISPDFVHGVRAMIQNNLNNHIMLDEEDKVMATQIPIDEQRISVVNGRTVYSWDDEHKDDPFVNVMYVDGPITRNGGACSYGSVEHRDIMMSCADSDKCVGHIFFINTPGGSAWAKNDYQQAIDYAREKGQPVIAFVDGMCCSAGMYLAALCDERYYMHPKDQIGCIGVMAAFYTEKDGSKCEYTNETYHEIYDPESFDKNIEYRDIANDGNTEKLIAELTALGVEFRADVKAACPKAKEEHLHGAVFDAEKVKGILMDGQMNFNEAFNRVIALAKKAGSPALASASAQTTNMSNINSNVSMKEKFPKVFALLGVEEMECNEEGSFFNAGLLQTLEEQISALQSANAEAKALAEQLTNEKAAMAEEHQKAIDNLNAEHTAAIEAKDAEINELKGKVENMEDDITAKEETIGNLLNDLNGAKESLTTAEQNLAERDSQLAEKDQQVQDLTAQVEELQKGAGAEPQAGAQPAGNGEGAEQASVSVGRYVYNKDLSYDENMRLKDEFEKK